MSAEHRLLVIDIDGTLLNRRGEVSTVDRAAVERARRAGIRVSLSTGRVVEACRRVLDYLGLDGYHMFFDGAFVVNPLSREEVYAEPIPRELVREMIGFTHEHGIDMELYSSERYFLERHTWSADIRRAFFDLEPEVADFHRVWQKERVLKATLAVRSPEEKAQSALFQQHFGVRLHFSWTQTPAYPDVGFINVINAAASKGRALEELAAFLGIPLEGTAAIGDGGNDVSLLARAGLGIAMSDAPDELKGVADHVVTDVEHNGVAEAIERFLL